MDFSVVVFVLAVCFTSSLQGSQHRKRHHHRQHIQSSSRQEHFDLKNPDEYSSLAEWKEFDSHNSYQRTEGYSHQRNSEEYGEEDRDLSLSRGQMLMDDPRSYEKTQSSNVRYAKEFPKSLQESLKSDSSSSLEDARRRGHSFRDKQPGNSRWTLKFHGMAKEHAKNYTSINITVQVGGNAFLPCKVGHLGDRQISWIRNWRVLTSGKSLYTQDQRLTVLHEPGSQDWVLHIKWVDLRDAGTYECQVSTGTGVISMFVNLKVVIPEAFIPGDGQHHVDKGSSISLKCIIKNSPSMPKYILWYHNGDLLNFLRNRPEVMLTTELHSSDATKGINKNSGLTEGTITENDTIISRLQVEEAQDYHSGNYTCSAKNTQSASTLVFITEGDKTAAVQRIDSGISRPAAELVFTLTFVIVFTIIR